MRNFDVGDKVESRLGVTAATVLEFGTCKDWIGDGGRCTGRETFRYMDPETGKDAWGHVDDFVMVDA